jgi:putative inorganic carbon (HCO3(-)) transporter
MTIPGRLDSFFSSPNYVAMYLAPITVLILGLVMLGRGIQTPTHKSKPGIILGEGQIPSPNIAVMFYFSIWLVFSLLTIFLTKSFGGWFSLLGGSIFLLIFIPKVTLKKTPGLIVFLIAITSLTFYAHQKSFSHYDNFWRVNSLQTRIQIWTNSLRLLALHPILGTGLADFRGDYQIFIDNLPPKEQPIERQVLRPHNLYLDFWLETGILGLIAFLWLILIFYQQTLSSYFNKQNLLTIPASAAMLAILLHALVDTPYFKNDLSLLFWFLIMINTALISRSNQK